MGGILLGTLDLLALLLNGEPGTFGSVGSPSIWALAPGIAYIGCTPLLIAGPISRDHTWVSGVGISLAVMSVLRLSLAAVHLILLARSAPTCTEMVCVHTDEEKNTSPVSLYDTHGPIVPGSPSVRTMQDQPYDSNGSSSSPPSLPHAELHRPTLNQGWLYDHTTSVATSTAQLQPDDHPVPTSAPATSATHTTQQAPRALPYLPSHTTNLSTMNLDAHPSLRTNERSTSRNNRIQVDGLGELILSSDSESEWGEQPLGYSPTALNVPPTTTRAGTTTLTPIRKRSTLSREERTQLKEARAIKRHLSQRGPSRPLGPRSCRRSSTHE